MNNEKVPDSEQYISVSEFAALVGVSEVAVYKRLKKGLRTYLKEVNGVKKVDRKALELYIDKPVNEPISEPGLGESINLLTQTVKGLMEQMEAKDKHYSGQLEAKDTQINQLNDRLRDALELTKAGHVLMIEDKQRDGFFKRLLKGFKQEREEQ